MLQNTGTAAKMQPKKGKYGDIRMNSARKKRKCEKNNRKSGRVALLGMALGDMDSREVFPPRLGKLHSGLAMQATS